MAAVVVPSEANARQAITIDYAFDQAWGAALRLIRVDYGYQLVRMFSAHERFTEVNLPEPTVWAAAGAALLALGICHRVTRRR